MNLIFPLNFFITCNLINQLFHLLQKVSPEFLEFLIPIEGDSVENYKKAISNFNVQSENLKDRLKKQMILKKNYLKKMLKNF